MWDSFNILLQKVDLFLNILLLILQRFDMTFLRFVGELGHANRVFAFTFFHLL